MKKVLFPVLGALLLAACGTATPPSNQHLSPLTDKIRFGESVLVHGDTLLAASFGSDQLDPLNDQRKGYILSFTDTTSQVLIPADSNLSAPKGMIIKDNHLFIADVGKMMVYDLSDRTAAPQSIPFPEGELFVNDMALDESTGTLYITVTNTGNIYSLDVTDPSTASARPLTFYTNVPGANGIVVSDGSMWVASYPPDGVTTADNVIYYIEKIASPQIVPIFDRQGQYDGLALSADGNTLYFTNWTGPEVGSVNLATGEVKLLPIADSLTGPARIQIKGDVLYIPDLPGSRVIRHKL